MWAVAYLTFRRPPPSLGGLSLRSTLVSARRRPCPAGSFELDSKLHSRSKILQFLRNPPRLSQLRSLTSKRISLHSFFHSHPHNAVHTPHRPLPQASDNKHTTLHLHPLRITPNPTRPPDPPNHSLRPKYRNLPQAHRPRPPFPCVQNPLVGLPLHHDLRPTTRSRGRARPHTPLPPLVARALPPGLVRHRRRFDRGTGWRG